MWMGHGSGDHSNHKENRTVRIAIADLTKGSGHVQGPFANSGGGNHSELSPGDIPQGIFIKCDGSDSNGWGWAVVKPYGNRPILTATDFDENYIPRTLEFTLGLYLSCDNPLAGGGNVFVEVYAA
jgi:hypothetical protein